MFYPFLDFLVGQVFVVSDFFVCVFVEEFWFWLWHTHKLSVLLLCSDNGFFDEDAFAVWLFDDFEHRKKILIGDGVCGVSYGWRGVLMMIQTKKTKKRSKRFSSHLSKLKWEIFYDRERLWCVRCSGLGRIFVDERAFVYCPRCEGRGFIRVGCSAERYLNSVCCCSLCKKTDLVLGIREILESLEREIRSR